MVISTKLIPGIFTVVKVRGHTNFLLSKMYGIKFQVTQFGTPKLIYLYLGFDFQKKRKICDVDSVIAL